MKKTPRWKKIECPRCQAPAGSNCRMEDGNWMLVHPERRAAAEIIPIQKVLTPTR